MKGGGGDHLTNSFSWGRKVRGEMMLRIEVTSQELILCWVQSRIDRGMNVFRESRPKMNYHYSIRTPLPEIKAIFITCNYCSFPRRAPLTGHTGVGCVCMYWGGGTDILPG